MGAKGAKQQLMGNTADGRLICFAFNNTSGCSTASCGRVHCCRVKGCGATDHGCHARPVACETAAEEAAEAMAGGGP